MDVNTKTKGILLIGLGLHYSKLAYNMALSIKRFSDIPVACITDCKHSDILKAFDHVLKPQMVDYLEGYTFNPFRLKTRIYEYTPFDHTIYLDVDGIALKDLTPLFTSKFKIQEVAKYTYATSDQCQMVWTDKAGKKLTDLYDAYKLPHDREYPEHNSSIIVFNKSVKNQKYFERAKELYNDRRLEFKPIGGLYPDELAWNLASAQLNHYSDRPHIKPIYFQWENKTMNCGGAVDKYYIFGMAGGFFTGKQKAFYETTVRQFSPYWKFDQMRKIFHKNR